MVRLVMIAVAPLMFAACSGGGSNEQPTGTLENAGAAGSAGPGTTVGGTDASDDVAVVSTGPSKAYTITAVAGFESPLVKLAHIDDQLPIARRANVETKFGGNPVIPRIGNPGLTYNCAGAGQRRNCDVYGTVIYNDPGTYPYTVTYWPSGVNTDPVTLTGSVVVREPSDFVIVSIGDSVASGEGNPMLPVDRADGAYWNNLASNYSKVPGVNDDNSSLLLSPGCHRSSFAGPAQAAAMIQRTNDVTFIHIACSGGFLRGINAEDKETRWYEVGEIDQVQLQLEWVQERIPRIDVLIISAGANNVNGGFSSVITKCLFNKPFKPCSEDEEFKQELNESMTNLPDQYRFLQTGIENTEEDKVPSVVAITEYFDPTRDADGNFPSIATSVKCEVGLVTPREWEFLYDNMVVPLNGQVAAAASLHGWQYVGGMAEAFRNHGYCASSMAAPTDFRDESWVVQFGESVAAQRDVAGTAHPDSRGQVVYRDAIYETIVQANPPRTVASATTEGQPYIFGTWVNTDVEVTLTATNPIQESGVRDTYYAPDEPICNAESTATGACQAYAGPFIISESGRHVVSFFSNNQFGAPETRAKPVQVLIDKEPPVMTCSASPDELWPPNKRLIEIAVSVTAVDEVSGPADYWLDAIHDSEGEAEAGVQDFEIGTNDTDGTMLADRSGNFGTRIYTLTYKSADALGNVGACDVLVRVLHDQRP